MRLRYLLLPLAFAILGLTSGCHRHCCCWGGGCCTPCCTPCGTCCGYTPVQGPMPPLASAPTPVPIAAPLPAAQVPMAVPH
ncbi:MAG TPA: hypothetical protein VH575_19625 [Gemmataceae bacterium]